jgi:hypothetical protein
MHIIFEDLICVVQGATCGNIQYVVVDLATSFMCATSRPAILSQGSMNNFSMIFVTVYSKSKHAACIHSSALSGTDQHLLAGMLQVLACLSTTCF